MGKCILAEQYICLTFHKQQNVSSNQAHELVN